jgi:hypothetical protein
VLNEFYRIAFRRKIYRSIDELQADLDARIAGYNQERPHQGRWCFGKKPMQTFLDAIPIAKEKMTLTVRASLSFHTLLPPWLQNTPRRALCFPFGAARRSALSSGALNSELPHFAVGRSSQTK